MTRFAPHSIEVEPRRRLEEVDEGLLRACYRRFAWLSLSPPKLLLMGLPTGGSLVAALMVRRLWRLSTLENQKLGLLADRLEHHAGSVSAVGDGATLASRVPGLRRLRVILVATGLLSIATALLFVGVAWTDWRAAFAPLLPWWASQGWLVTDAVGLALHGCSTLSFVAVSLAVLGRRMALGRFVAAWNELATQRGSPVVRMPRRWLRWPGWNAMIVVLALVGPAWSAAMALAGLLMLGYIRGTSDVLFVQFGESLRALLVVPDAGVFVPAAPDVLQRCDDERCNAARPEGVPYCPRCDRRGWNGRRA